MTGDTRVTMHKSAALLVAIALLVAGAGAAYLLVPHRATSGDNTPRTQAGDSTGTPTAAQPAAAEPTATASTPLPDVEVPLTVEAVERAGIVVESVTEGTSAAQIRLPGVVEPNAYRQVVVTPLVSGRVIRVGAMLGDRVRRGQTLAEIFSPELAEARARYSSAQAMLDAHDRELRRTERLVEIGAASRQELERLHAEHAVQTAAVHSARSQLELLDASLPSLDASASDTGVEATTRVPAPIDGVVTERAANVGLNVNTATALFTIVDLSTVWIVADLYERDFSQVHIGSDATITAPAYPALALRGRVSYIDPLVNSATRTARVRVEVANPRVALRLGMLAEVVITGSSGVPVVRIRRSAVQHIGGTTVVYLARPNQPGQFVERHVRLGAGSGEHVEVLSGVQAGDVVVSEGGFFIRAERERLGLRTAPREGPARFGPVEP